MCSSRGDDIVGHIGIKLHGTEIRSYSYDEDMNAVGDVLLCATPYTFLVLYEYEHDQLPEIARQSVTNSFHD